MITNLANLLSEGAEMQSIFDSFMLQNIDFKGMTWKKIEETIEMLRYEADVRRSRVLANHDEAEKKAIQQAFSQTVALLYELEKWLFERKVELSQNEEISCEYVYDDLSL